MALLEVTLVLMRDSEKYAMKFNMLKFTGELSQDHETRIINHLNQMMIDKDEFHITVIEEILDSYNWDGPNTIRRMGMYKMRGFMCNSGHYANQTEFLKSI